MPSAAALTCSAVTMPPHAFQEFQPSGGVSASMCVPPTNRDRAGRLAFGIGNRDFDRRLARRFE
jgi:hypothetical protein